MRLSADFQYSGPMFSGLSETPGRCETKDFMAASRWVRLSASVGTSSRNWIATLVEDFCLPALDVLTCEITASINKSMQH